MKQKYYLAYGSNLSMAQMAHRCPDAIYVGMAVIPDYRLLFKGSKTGSYLTIERKCGSSVPVLVWRISAEDEQRLDRYEGCPDFYYKTTMGVELHSMFDGSILGEVDALVYIMHEDRPLGCPTYHYLDVCAEGYERFGFDKRLLRKALKDSKCRCSE